MIRTILPIILTCAALSAAAQQTFSIAFDREGKAIAIPQLRKYNFNIPEYSFGYVSPTPSPSFDISDKNGYEPSSLAALPSNIQVLSTAYRPYFNPFMPMLAKASYTAFDFDEASVMPLNENLALLALGNRTTLPFLGGQTTFTSMLAWRHERLSIIGGGFVGAFYTPYNLSPARMGGLNLNLRYELSDRFALRSWGSYTLYEGNEKMNPYVNTISTYNHTGFGNAIEFMITDGFGLGAGARHQFNYRTGRLETQPVVYPVFKIGKVTIGGY